MEQETQPGWLCIQVIRLNSGESFQLSVFEKRAMLDEFALLDFVKTRLAIVKFLTFR
jgi:hypothetical protein